MASSNYGFFLLFAILASYQTLSLSSLSQTLSNGAGTVSSIALSTVASPLLNFCTPVKDVMGLSYAQMAENAPELEKLTVNFMCGTYNETYKLTTAAEDILAAKYYNSSQKLYLFIHGWSVSPWTVNSTFSYIRDALFDEGNNNVLVLDASDYIGDDSDFVKSYLQSTTYAIFIGRKLAEVLIGLQEDGLPRTEMHIIGHSLGAQIAGFAGKTFQNHTGSKIGRITGLDAAGVCFTGVEPEYRLNATDAEFVDVIHTNGGLKGTAESVGHVDFFPNGGQSQPGCLTTSCNHNRVIQLYAESIANPQAFPAVRCGSWLQFVTGSCDVDVVNMGFGTPTDTKEGNYYLETAASSAYDLGTDGTKYTVL